MPAVKPTPPLENQDEIRVGNKTSFSDDIWDISEFMSDLKKPKCQMRIDFRFLPDPMKLTAKQYAYLKMGTLKPSTIITKIYSLRPFAEYCGENKIKSFDEITPGFFKNFIEKMQSALDGTWKTKTKRKVTNLHPKTAYTFCHTVEEIIKTGQVKGWKVSDHPGFKELNTHDYFKKRIKKKSKPTDRKPIPDFIFDQIIKAALENEDSILTKSGIIILSQTGIRCSELISLKKGCIRLVDNSPTLSFQVSKTEKGDPVMHQVVCNDLVVSAVKELEEATQWSRDKIDSEYLFISEGPKNWKDYRPLTAHAMHLRVKRFVTKHKIRDRDDNLYTQLHPHQFRKTWVTQAVLSGKPIQGIQKQLAHKSLVMSARYANLNTNDLKRKYSEILFHPGSKLAGRRAKRIKYNIKKLCRNKTDAEIDALIKDLSNSLNFQPLPMGICIYDERRAKCTDGDGCFIYNCVNFITEHNFLPILKKELGLYENKMNRSKRLGQLRDYQIAKKHRDQLSPLVDDLERQK